MYAEQERKLISCLNSSSRKIDKTTALAREGKSEMDFARYGRARSEGRLERSDSKSNMPPTHITNNLLLVAALLAGTP